MPSGRVRINLAGLSRAERQVREVNPRATSRSFKDNITRIAGAYNQQITPIDTSRLIRSFRLKFNTRGATLQWGGMRIDGVQVDYAEIANRRGSSAGYADRVVKETARDMAQYAKTGKPPRRRTVRRYGRNRQGL